MPNLLTAWREGRDGARGDPPPTSEIALTDGTPQRSIVTIDDYAAALSDMVLDGANAWGFGPSQVHWQYEPAERVTHSFEGYARQLYEGNGLVYAVMGVRILAFSLVRFSFQAMRNGRPGKLFGTPSLAQLERPWEGGTTQDLLMRIMLDADIAGNAYITRVPGLLGPELLRLRPDWVQIILMPITLPGGGVVGWRRVGYTYHDGGIEICPPERVALLTTGEVAHFAPRPAAGAAYRGESWLTPVVREIINDKMMLRHQTKFFENAATANLSVSLHESITPEAFADFKEKMNLEHRGLDNAWKTLFLGGGADVKVIGANLEQIAFDTVQGRGETRVAAAGGVPPIIVGLSEGLASSTYCGTYNEAVWTPRGIVKLGEVAVGDPVWSLVDDRIQARKVVWHAQTGTKPVYTVRTKNRTIRFTDNHPVLVRVPGNSRGGNAERSARVEWRRVDQLKVGDRVVQAQRLPDCGLTSLPNGSPATEDALRWLGAYTGDGALNGNHGVRMCLPVRDRVRAPYEAVAQRLFTKQTSWRRPGRQATDGLTEEMVRLRQDGLTHREIVARMGLSLHPMSVRDRIRHATREFVAPTAPITLREARNAFEFSSTRAVQWHHDMGVTGTARTKRVPRWVFELREDLRLAYLAGIVDTDGSVGKDGRLGVQFAGRELVEDVRMLLISCGIACSNIAHVEFKASVLPNPGLSETYEAWKFVASSAVEVGRIPFLDPVYRERVDAHQHRHRPGGGDAAKAGLHEDLGFYTVRSIEVGEPEPVYDIEVQDGHSFLVDGVVVHNSNYGQAMRRFGELTMASLWGNVAGSLATLVPPPGADARLWYDTRDVAFLREDAMQRAQIQATKASMINTYITAGFTPDSSVDAAVAEDETLLEHTGLVSVQLQPPGARNDGETGGQNAAPPPAAPAAGGGRAEAPLSVDDTDRTLMYANAHPHPALALTNGSSSTNRKD